MMQAMQAPSLGSGWSPIEGGDPRCSWIGRSQIDSAIDQLCAALTKQIKMRALLATDEMAVELWRSDSALTLRVVDLRDGKPVASRERGGTLWGERLSSEAVKATVQWLNAELKRVLHSGTASRPVDALDGASCFFCTSLQRAE